jgi:hypothetical protein
VSNGPMDMVMSTVQLPDETIAKLCDNSRFGADILDGVINRLADRLGERQRVKVSEVLEALDVELQAWRAGTKPEHWTKDVVAREAAK